MKMTVLIERLDEGRYRASTSHPITIESEGCSRDEAVERLRDQAAQRLSGGELVQVQIPGAPDANPWLSYAGIWKDHADFDAVMENISEYRRTVK
jgi:predicted RNase H-like HicB family nuclease